METMVVQMKQHYTDIMEQKLSDNDELYTDLNNWLGVVHLAIATAKLEEVSEQLQHLYNADCDVMGVPQESRCTVYQCYISSGGGLF